MKALIINGSPRQKGNTSIALTEIAKQLEKLGIESEIVWIGNKDRQQTCPWLHCLQYVQGQAGSLRV